ncbi:MAG: hypothetical protein OSB62_04295 [Alphaproteobacteria bacterium]|nr:hypothetical protein [Alphaproteobacteria bacterium]
MAKPKVELIDVRIVVGKKMVGKFFEIVEASTLKNDKNPNFNKKRRVLKCCIDFMYAVTKSWNYAYDYSERMKGQREAILVVSSINPGIPPYSSSLNTPTVPALHVRGIAEDDTPVVYNEKLARYDLACIAAVGKFLGVHLSMKDFGNPTPQTIEKVSLIINTIVWYTHVILVVNGKKQIKSLGYKVKTPFTPSSEETLPFSYGRPDVMNPFPEDFCRPEFFGKKS